MAINPFVGLGYSNYGYRDRMRGVFGGEKSYMDPYTSGYHMAFFYPPTAIAAECGSFLTTVCQKITFPYYNVTTIDFNGINNKKWSVPGNVEISDNKFTCTFTELAGLPIMQIMGKWVSIFRNPLYGISDPDINGSSRQVTYKGRVVACTMLPDHKTIQHAAVFMGVFPLKVPMDFDSARETQDKKEHDIEFAFDDMYTGTSVISLASSLISAYTPDSISAVDDIYNNEVN